MFVSAKGDAYSVSLNPLLTPNVTISQFVLLEVWCFFCSSVVNKY